MTDTVKFDPGIGNLYIDLSEVISPIYQQIHNMPALLPKRIKFKMSKQKIINVMKNNISFYAGCLMWAYYLYNMEDEKEIEGNAFLNMSEDDLKEEVYLQPVFILDAYFETFVNDMRYYLGEKFQIPEKWLKIIDAYNKFLRLNKSFCNTRTNKQILLPDIIKNCKFDFNIEELINEAINQKNLELLLEKIDL